MNFMENKNVNKLEELESKLWECANHLRGALSAEDYMHTILGIIILKYINDAYENAKNELLNEGFSLEEINNPNDTSLLNDKHSIIIPSKESSWQNIISHITTNDIGNSINNAIRELEDNYPYLVGAFPTRYHELDNINLSNVVKIFNEIDIKEYRADLLGNVYEYFLGKFFLDRGQKGGEFYTPRSIVELMTRILDIKEDSKIYDPACGTGGMLIGAKRWLETTNQNVDTITCYGQEKNQTTRKLAILNFILNYLYVTDHNKTYFLGKRAADTFSDDQHESETFDYVLANPPFNLEKWFNESLKDDPRWKYGIPPANNANYAWIQHIIYKLKPSGKAGVVLARGSLTSSISSELEIRKEILKCNKISCIIDLPNKLFYTTQIPACLWFFDNNKTTNKVLFIDAQSLGTPINNSKKHKEINQDNILKIVNFYKEFLKNDNIDIPGFAKSVSLSEIEDSEYSLLPGRYISELQSEKKDHELIKEELKHDIDELTRLMKESSELEQELLEAIKKINLN